jgi:hypothetical protein
MRVSSYLNRKTNEFLINKLERLRKPTKANVGMANLIIGVLKSRGLNFGKDF